MGETLDVGIWLLVAVLLLLALAAAVITVRRILLERGGGTIDCGLRFLPVSPGSPGSAGSWGAPGPWGSPGPSGASRSSEASVWRPGVAAYRQDELHWFGALGILLRPTSKFSRRSLTVVSRRPCTASEAGVLGSGRAVVEVETGPVIAGFPVGKIELAMTPEALTGFLAWLEASPPSSHLQDIS